MSNKLDAERQISHVFFHMHTSIHMYYIWITLEQMGGQKREEARERRKGEWAQKKEECWTWSKYMTHLKEIIYVTPNTVYYKYPPIKGKVQNKNLNAGKALPFSTCSALLARSSKDFIFLTCLLVSRDNECTVHGRVRLEVEGIQAASVLFTPGCTQFSTPVTHLPLVTMHQTSRC